MEPGKEIQSNFLSSLLISYLFQPALLHLANLSLAPGPDARNTKMGSITVLLTSCLTDLDYSVLWIKTKVVSCHTANFKPVKQEVNGIAILSPLGFPWWCLHVFYQSFWANSNNFWEKIKWPKNKSKSTWMMNRKYELFFSLKTWKKSKNK